MMKWSTVTREYEEDGLYNGESGILVAMSVVYRTELNAVGTIAFRLGYQ